MEEVSICLKEEELVRPTADFHPNVWGDHFVHYTSPSPSALLLQDLNPRIEELKEEVKARFRNFNDLSELLIFIDDIQHLGVEYLFTEEIQESLTRIQDLDEQPNDLHTVALRFRLLRQQGHNISSDVFEKFKNSQGKFKEELANDAEGLLRLYEASWLGTHEDKILDEAVEFAKVHIESKVAHSTDDDVLVGRMRRALEMPFPRRIRRLEARSYIELYNQYDESRSNALLELAKLDFNHLQSLHQAEIKALSIWWQEWGISEKLSFSRDRTVEMYFWTLGVCFEPQYSEARLLFAKFMSTFVGMDDIFDAYGTFKELQLFNDVIQRWDLQDTEKLPEYMKIYLKFFVSVINEIEEELISKGRIHRMPYFIKSIKAWVGGYMEEARTLHNRYIPTIEEYLLVGVFTTSHPLLTVAIATLMGGEEVTDDVFAWILGVPKIVKASSVHCRLMDDLASTKKEQLRTHAVSSVQCYMNEHGVTEQEARAKLHKMVEDALKDMNKEFLFDKHYSHKKLIATVLDLTRIIEEVYQNEDNALTETSSRMKEKVDSLLVHPILD